MISPDHRFAAQVSGLEIDHAAAAEIMATVAPARRRYVIVFTARSGSTWLSNILAKTERLGYPEEYINPDFLRDVARFMNAATPEAFLQALLRRRKTANNVFGIEARAADIDLFGAETFFQIFDDETKFFNLWRENILAQAISLYRAVSTRYFHSTDAAAAGPPPYDTDAIAHWLTDLANAENENIAMLRHYNRPFRSLRYETITANRHEAVMTFIDALGARAAPDEFAAPAADDLVKIGDAWNEAAEARFRAERAGFLAGIEAARAVRSVTGR